MSIADVISVARAQIGKPYQFGAVGPKAFDCSGLVVYAFSNGANKALPHFTGTLISMGTAVSKDQLQPGDLVFPDSGHVQIYTGDGHVVEAPHRGVNVREVPMWGFWRARRIDVGQGSNGGGIVMVDNPLIPDGVEKFLAFISSGDTWVRASWYMMGSILILVGIVLLTKDSGVVAEVAKVVK